MNSPTFSGREAKVARFHDAVGHPPVAITDPNNRLKLAKRLSLITEEFDELYDAATAIFNRFHSGAVVTPDMVFHFIKELADLQYVVSGTAVEFGIDLETAFNIVHHSNMTKIDPLTGKPYAMREDGKVLKGPHYEAPSMIGVSYVGG